MKIKVSRLDLLKQILTTTEAASQEEILKELFKEGYTLTQATLSRDLKQLKASKVANKNGNYIYVLPSNPLYHRVTENMPLSAYSHPNFESIDFSGNICIVHTRAGYASGLSTEIDACKIGIVVGTIAGDDTIMIVLREGADRKELIRALKPIIPNIDDFYQEVEKNTESETDSKTDTEE